MKKSILVLTPAILLMLSACKLPFFPTSQSTTSDAGSQTTSETTSQGGNTSQGENTSSGGTTSQGGSTSGGGTTSQGGGSSSDDTTSQGGGSSSQDTTSQGGSSSQDTSSQGGNTSQTPSETTTISKTIGDLAIANNWTISAGTDITCYKEFALDTVITISTTGADSCGSVWDSKGTKEWRLYQAKQGNVTVSATENHDLVSVTFTFTIENSGTLLKGTEKVTSAKAVSLSGSSATFTVGNSGTASNGQVKISAISVTYTGEGGDVPPTPGPIAPTSITVTPANASIEQGKIQQFSAALAPQGATGTVTWSVKDANEGAVTKVSVNDAGLVSVAADAPEGSYKVYATVGEVSGSATFTVTEAGGDVPPQPGEAVTDVLTATSFDVSGTVYGNHTATGTTGTYSANCAGDKGSIQLRSSNSTSGVIGHLDSQNCSSITLEFHSDTSSERVVDIYASNTAFTIAAMYGTSVTKVGEIAKNGTNFKYTFESDYSYIGLRSHSGALYLTSITIVWGDEGGSEAPTSITVSPTSANVKQGSSQEFSAALGPHGATGTISWEVAKKNATDDSKVTLSATTGATVTATVANDATVDAVYTLTATCGQLSDSVEITVLDKGSGPEYQDTTFNGGTAVTVNGLAAKKFGSGSVVGSTSITVPANTTKLKFYAVGWKGDSVKLSLSCTGVTFSPNQITLVSNDAITGTTEAFEFTVDDSKMCFEISLSGVSSEKTLNISATSGKRFVLWNGQYAVGE